MRTTDLLGLLLDPFLTFEEAVRQCGAVPAPAREARAASAGTAAPNRRPATVHRPTRTEESGGPVLPHPPAAAG